MDDSTAQRLNTLNQAFYRQTARDFDTTRQAPWSGWDRLLRSVQLPVESALDIGCGNGRFGRFLAARQARELDYCGIDNNADLLTYASAQLQSYPHVRANLLPRDILMQPWPQCSVRLVALFGLLHHVPGLERRQNLLRTAAACVLPGGWLAFTAWRFLDSARLQRRIVPWSAEFVVEAGDYLLDWRRGSRAIRYCHHIDDAEHDCLIAATGLPVVDDYREDGGLNRYTILRRDPAA
ncbi:MAG: class I SAM-dependent methyltransferase [Chloroflexi bacterium]|nr:class I SAM-dependent methyltransferase [Chloroflexota bacterium]MCY4246013.1 class I SAM-dependent methyltransferase [Chloroflexota bacterium]